MYGRLAAFSVRRSRLVLVVTGLLLAAMAIAAGSAFSALKNGGFDDPASGSSRAAAVIDGDFGGQTNLILMVSPDNGLALTAPEVTAAAQRIGSGLAERTDVASITSYWTSQAPALRAKDGRSALITMHVRGDDVAGADSAAAIIEAYATTDGPVQVRAGGQLGVGQDIGEQLGKSLALAEGIAVPLTLILLIVAFGSLLAALLPLLIGVVAVAGTFAELAVLGRVTDVSIYAVNLTTALGLGLAIDYSLLMVNRFREELRTGADVADAVSTTVRTAGRTIVFSSATVAVALAAMLLFPVYFLRSFAYAGIGVVVIAMLASLIALPALLATLGSRLAPRSDRGRRSGEESPMWRRVATFVMRRPVAVALPVIAVLLAIGTPVLHIAFGTPDDRVLQNSATSRQVGDILRTQYSGATSTINVVLQGTTTPDALAGYRDRMAELPGVTAVADPVARADAQYLAVTGFGDPNSEASQNLVKQVRAVSTPEGTTVLVGGSTATLVDSKTAITDTAPWAVLWIALTTLVLLFLFTGSVVLPLKALALNVLSLSAVFGVLVWIFQDGHLSGLLGFTPAPINTAMIVLMFCIAFGLSMDYEVFLLARIKEAHDRGADTVEAVATGLARTGRIVTTAAALLAITFFAFATAEVSFIQLFGIGTGIAIVLDATVIRGLLVPAFMRIAGEVNWWAPKPLRALHNRIGLSETAGSSDDPDDRPATPRTTESAAA